MTVSYRTGITILQFIFFVPSLILSAYLCVHHGLKGAATWRFVATFSALRVSGDVAYFITLSYPSLNAYVALIVCEMLGLAPLMLTCISLVFRVNRSTNTLPGKSMLVVTFLSLVGLILGIVGTDRALEDAPTTDDVHTNALMKAALALFLVGYGIMVFAFFAVILDIVRHPAKRLALGTEIRILYIVGLASPFVLVRYVYGALGDYTTNMKFSTLYGDDTVYLCMGILMEIFAIAICLSSAFVAPAPKAEVEKEPLGSSHTNTDVPLAPTAQDTAC